MVVGSILCRLGIAISDEDMYRATQGKEIGFGDCLTQVEKGQVTGTFER